MSTAGIAGGEDGKGGELHDLVLSFLRWIKYYDGINEWQAKSTTHPKTRESTKIAGKATIDVRLRECKRQPRVASLTFVSPAPSFV